MPSVCLNYGVTTPTPQHVFHLVDVDEYTQDPRPQGIAEPGDPGDRSDGAQAVAWAVFNGLTMDELLSQPVLKMNDHEVALAARILDELDRSGPTGLIDPSKLRDARLFLRVQGGTGHRKRTPLGCMMSLKANGC
ncbi:MAG: hypothetical protein U0800_05365 [Isosphaeraceae bacterium]